MRVVCGVAASPTRDLRPQSEAVLPPGGSPAWPGSKGSPGAVSHQQIPLPVLDREHASAVPVKHGEPKRERECVARKRQRRGKSRDGWGFCMREEGENRYWGTTKCEMNGVLNSGVNKSCQFLIVCFLLVCLCVWAVVVVCFLVPCSSLSKCCFAKQNWTTLLRVITPWFQHRRSRWRCLYCQYGWTSIRLVL